MKKLAHHRPSLRANRRTVAPWPDATGAAIGLHDTNWQPWPQGATGITAIGAEWTEVNP